MITASRLSSKCEINHIDQRGRMLLPQQPQTRLHDLHLQLFSRLPSSLVVIDPANCVSLYQLYFPINLNVVETVVIEGKS